MLVVNIYLVTASIGQLTGSYDHVVNAFLRMVCFEYDVVGLACIKLRMFILSVRLTCLICAVRSC